MRRGKKGIHVQFSLRKRHGHRRTIDSPGLWGLLLLRDKGLSIVAADVLPLLYLRVLVWADGGGAGLAVEVPEVLELELLELELAFILLFSRVFLRRLFASSFNLIGLALELSEELLLLLPLVG